MQINYEQPVQGAYVGTTAITSAETAVITLTNADYLRQSQITAYFSLTLLSATSAKIRYYYTPDNGTTWYQVCNRNETTGVLADIPSVIDSSSPSQSGVKLLVEDIPFSGSNGLKVTIQGAGSSATATLNKAYIYVRDN